MNESLKSVGEAGPSSGTAQKDAAAVTER
jgi:hypothetical protein